MSHLKPQSQFGSANKKEATETRSEYTKGRPFPKRRECPICFCTLISPVYQCFNGHLICEPCLIQVSKDKCPVCRERYPQNRRIRAREFEEIMRECTADCRNAGFGCSAVLHYDEILEHESNCRYKHLRCPGVDGPCGDHLKDNQWTQHLELVHGLSGLGQYRLGDEVEICQNFNLPQLATTKWSIKTGAHFLRFENHTFFVRTNISFYENGEFVQWAVTRGQDGGTCTGFQAVIKLVFCQNTGEPTVQTKWSGQVMPNKHDMMTETMDRSKFLWVPMAQLNFYGHDGWKLFVKILANDEARIKVEKLKNCQKLHSTLALQSATASEHRFLSTVTSDSSSSLRLENNETAGIIVHRHVSCDECYAGPIQGIRFKCKECHDFDLCQSCFGQGFHAGHLFYKILQSNVMSGGGGSDQETEEWLCQQCTVLNNVADLFCVACGDLRHDLT